MGHHAAVTQRLSPAERVSIVILTFTAWTFLLTAAIGSPVVSPAPAEEGPIGDFRLVYDVLWLTSVAAFLLLVDRALGAERPWLRRLRAILVAAVAIGGVLVPILMLALLIR